MILVHAGNRVDPPDATQTRFPDQQVNEVAARLNTFIGALRPRVVVSAAAAGADLILLEAALAHGCHIHVVLPFRAERFRAESVADRGNAWLIRYDRVLEQARSRPGCQIIEHDEQPDDAGYRQGNHLLLEHAATVAGDDGILALAIQPPARTGGSSVTDDFAQRAMQRGLAVIDIDPTVRLVDRPTAFVVMPFGEKTIGQRTVDCDETFRRLLVPLLEDADLHWDRADRQLDTGIIHVGMIQQLGNADVVVVDTIGESPNVYYELGMRHALADKVTLLLSPQGTSPPFDTRPVRHFAYRLPGHHLEDQAALDALRALQPVLAEALQRAEQDSPLYYFFQRAPERLRTRDEKDPRLLIQLHDQIEHARELHDGPTLQQLAGEVTGAALHRDERRQLLLLIGMGLREAGLHQPSVDCLRPLSYQSTEGSYALWAQQLAFALRRCGENTETAGGDPEPSWREAQQLLQHLLRVIGDDSESCGIAAGLAKQRARRALQHQQRPLAEAQLEQAADLYVRGAEAAPADYYTTLNAATTLRVLAQHFQGGTKALTHARRLLPIAEYFADRDSSRHPTGFWPAVTVAECHLTRHLLDGTPAIDDVALNYTRATTRQHHPDALQSVNNQLQFYQLAGDPPEVVQRVQAALQ